MKERAEGAGMTLGAHRRGSNAAHVGRVARSDQRMPVVVLLVAIAVVASLGCDAELVSQAPSTVCIEAGRQCALPSGPLGVCEQTRCTGDAKFPCFACISQH